MATSRTVGLGHEHAAMRLVEAYITYIVNNISRKNLKSYTAELQEVTSPLTPLLPNPLGSPQSDARPPLCIAQPSTRGYLTAVISQRRVPPSRCSLQPSITRTSPKWNERSAHWPSARPSIDSRPFSFVGPIALRQGLTIAWYTFEPGGFLSYLALALALGLLLSTGGGNSRHNRGVLWWSKPHITPTSRYAAVYPQPQ